MNILIEETKTIVIVALSVACLILFFLYDAQRDRANFLQQWKDAEIKHTEFQNTIKARLCDILPHTYLGWDVLEATLDYVKSLKQHLDYIITGSKED